mmetsp:Transcript_9215/g.31856  ORF Transcript_9215/g.31856 Transcript_9215/m.31856 type:complete len:299 (-) Transcript_9215:127-1023(-)
MLVKQRSLILAGLALGHRLLLPSHASPVCPPLQLPVPPHQVLQLPLQPVHDVLLLLLHLVLQRDLVLPKRGALRLELLDVPLQVLLLAHQLDLLVQVTVGLPLEPVHHLFLLLFQLVLQVHLVPAQLGALRVQLVQLLLELVHDVLLLQLELLLQVALLRVHLPQPHLAAPDVLLLLRDPGAQGLALCLQTRQPLHELVRHQLLLLFELLLGGQGALPRATQLVFKGAGAALLLCQVDPGLRELGAEVGFHLFPISYLGRWARLPASPAFTPPHAERTNGPSRERRGPTHPRAGFGGG